MFHDGIRQTPAPAVRSHFRSHEMGDSGAERQRPRSQRCERGREMWAIWGFPDMGICNNGWFIRENPIKMDDDWGYPYLRKPPYV